jgi:hypothetical protein
VLVQHVQGLALKARKKGRKEGKKEGRKKKRE